MAIRLTTETSLLDVPGGTVLEVQVRKPDWGSVQVILVAPDGRFKVLTEWKLMTHELMVRNAAHDELPEAPEMVEGPTATPTPAPLTAGDIGRDER